MNPASQLLVLQERFLAQLDRLEKRVGVTSVVGPVEGRRTVGLVCVEALNAWTQFCRAYYLSSACSAKRAQGGRMTSSLGRCTPGDALLAAVKELKPWVLPKAGVPTIKRRDEPTWHDPHTLLELARRLTFSNETAIQSAFGMSLRVFDDAPRFRNYFAHRNWDSSMAAQRIAPIYGIPASERPWAILLANAPGRPRKVIEDWLDDYRLTAEALCL